MENELQITTNEKNDVIIRNPDRRLVIENEMGEEIKIKIKDSIINFSNYVELSYS